MNFTNKSFFLGAMIIAFLWGVTTVGGLGGCGGSATAVENTGTTTTATENNASSALATEAMEISTTVPSN